MNKLLKNVLVLLVAFSFLLSSCDAVPADYQTAIASGEVREQECVSAPSDNGKMWAMNSCVWVSTVAYEVTVRISDDLLSTQTINSESYGSVVGMGGSVYGSSSSRMWTEGKGTVPVKLLNISHEFPMVEVGQLIILKTTDLKAISLPVGAIVLFVCSQDAEVTSPVYSGQLLTTDRVTYELDNCRMKSPAFTMGE